MSEHKINNNEKSNKSNMWAKVMLKKLVFEFPSPLHHTIEELCEQHVDQQQKNEHTKLSHILHES